MPKLKAKLAVDSSGNLFIKGCGVVIISDSYFKAFYVRVAGFARWVA